MHINPAIPGTLTRIAAGNLGAPRLSADGSTVVYTQWVNNQWDVMRWRDGKTEAISDDPHDDVDPAVSADGDMVVWSRYSNLDGGNPDGNFDVYQWQHGVTSPVADTPADEMSPTVSDDAKVVAWVYDDPKLPIGFDIQERKDGKTDFVTTDWPVDIDPFVNQDGSRIFFRRKIELDDGDLWMCDERGDIRRLTDTPWGEWNAVTDAAGKNLSWSEDNTGNHKLFRYDVDRGLQTLVAAEPGVDHMESTLSGDGSRIAWVRQDRRVGQPSDPQILLSENGQTVPFTVDGINTWPKMSHDGRVFTWLAVESGDGGSGAQTDVIYRFERDVPPLHA